MRKQARKQPALDQRPSLDGSANPGDTQPSPNLGNQVGFYHPRAFTAGSCLGAMLVIIAGVSMVGYGGRTIYIRYIQYGFAAAISPIQPWFWAGWLILLGVFVWCCSRLITARMHLTIYQNGISYQRGLSRTRRLLWSEIAGIALSMRLNQFLSVHGRICYQARIFPKNGRSFLLTAHIPQLAEALSYIKAGLYTRLQPILQADFETGQWIAFGPFAIHQTGLGILKKPTSNFTGYPDLRVMIAWEALTKIAVNNGYLRVKYQTGRRSLQQAFPVSVIPNLELLLQLIQQVE